MKADPPLVELTLLSSILGGNFPIALERQKAARIKFLDIKDGVWGKTIEQLNPLETQQAETLINAFGFGVHCFSTSIGHTPLEPGTDEAAFRALHEPALQNVLRVALVLRPRVIRLLAPRLSPASDGETAMERLMRDFPWVMGVYRDWADQIAQAHFGVLIENETQGCLLGSIGDIQTFFAELNRPETVGYTWDVQNLWQSGTFPTLDVYHQLKPLIGAVHLKGGRAGDDGKTLEWAAPLDEASWPVLEIVRAVVEEGVAPFICLNPSHGQKPLGWNVWEVAQREIAFLRREVKGIAA